MFLVWSQRDYPDRCASRRSCEIFVSSETFGDPCPGTFKYLELQYSCVLGMSREGCLVRSFVVPSSSLLLVRSYLVPSSLLIKIVWLCAKNCVKILRACNFCQWHRVSSSSLPMRLGAGNGVTENSISNVVTFNRI